MASFLWDTVSVVHGLQSEHGLADFSITDFTLSISSELQRVRYGTRGEVHLPADSESVQKPATVLLWALDKKKPYANEDALAKKIAELPHFYVLVLTQTELIQELAGFKLGFSRLMVAADWGLPLAGPWQAILVFSASSTMSVAASLYDAIVDEVSKNATHTGLEHFLLSKTEHKKRQQLQSSRKRQREGEEVEDPDPTVVVGEEPDEWAKLRGVVLPEAWTPPEHSDPISKSLQGLNLPRTAVKNAHIMLHHIRKLATPAVMFCSTRKLLSTRSLLDAAAAAVPQDFANPALVCMRKSSESNSHVRRVLPLEILTAKGWRYNAFNLSFLSPAMADAAASKAPLQPMLLAMLMAILAAQSDY